MRDVLRWIDRHDGARPSRSSPRRTGADAPATDLLAGSSPPTPGSSRASGRPHRASWPRTARRPRWHRPARRPSTSQAFCDGPNTLYVCSTRTAAAPIRAAGRGHRRGRARRRLRPVPRRARAARRPSSPSTRSPTSLPSPTCRPWSAREPARGCWCWPACRTSPRPAAAGGAAADGFLSLFGTTVVLRGHRGHGDAARPQRAGGRPRGRRHDGQPLRGPLGPPPALDVGRHARANPASRSTPSPTAPRAAHSCSARTRRWRRSRSRRPTSASPWRELVPPGRRARRAAGPPSRGR